MTFETVKPIIDSLLQSTDLTNKYLNLSNSYGVIFNFIGGEPLLEIDLIQQITDYILGEMFRLKHPLMIKVAFGISTNGLLHFEPKVQEYLYKHKNHLSYSVSIDGNQTLHDSCRLDKNGNGTYARAIAAALDYRDNIGGKLGNKMTLAPDNISYLYDAVVSMLNNGYRTLFLNCVYEEGWTKEHANTFYHSLKDIVDYIFDNDLDS